MTTDQCVPLLSLAPLVTVTPSKQTESSEGETAPEVGALDQTHVCVFYQVKMEIQQNKNAKS